MDSLPCKIHNKSHFRNYEFVFTLVINSLTVPDIYEIEEWLQCYSVGGHHFIRYFIANTVIYIVFFERDIDACKFKFNYGDKASLTTDLKPANLK